MPDRFNHAPSWCLMLNLNGIFHIIITSHIQEVNSIFHIHPSFFRKCVISLFPLVHNFCFSQVASLFSASRADKIYYISYASSLAVQVFCFLDFDSSRTHFIHWQVVLPRIVVYGCVCTCDTDEMLGILESNMAQLKLFYTPLQYSISLVKTFEPCFNHWFFIFSITLELMKYNFPLF